MTTLDPEAGDIHLYDDVTALHKAATQRWVEIAQQAIAERGVFHVALSGGSTPEHLYQLLAAPPYKEALDWQRVHIYFGDERCVPPEHADSNYRMVKEALLDHLSIPRTNVHRMAAENDDLDTSAAAYAQLLNKHLPRDEQGVSQFDLVMLGLGPDGHVASLFPDTKVLKEQERMVAPVHVPKLEACRLTITFLSINHARHIMLLVAGDNKAPILKELTQPRPTATPYPVELIQPRGQMEWYIDRAAASFLD